MNVIGRYKILDRFPTTGIATVYKAVDQEFDGEVVIKLFPVDAIKNPSARARFEREIQLISLLEHPNIVPIYDIGEIENQFYVVTPLMMGGSLADRLA